MTTDKKEWARARDELVAAITDLGFPKELGDEIAKTLGSPKAMRRMNAYLYNVKPSRVELLVDEMLAIRDDIDRWKDKKAAEEANAAYNDILNNGF